MPPIAHLAPRFSPRPRQSILRIVNAALVGSVSSSAFALDALIRGGVQLTAIFGVDESQRERISDYRSLREQAVAAGVPFHSFIKVTEPHVEVALRANPPDLLWVIGLSQMAPPALVRLARHGGVGFHPTLLPEGRGRAPVAWTILIGARAAATLFFLSGEPDAGDIIAQREVPVLPDDYSEDLIHRTNVELGSMILDLAPAIRTGRLPRRPQDHARATYYPRRTPADGLIDWTAPAAAVYRLIRAAGRPYPGAFTVVAGRKLTIWRANPADVGDVGAADGTAADSASEGVPGACLGWLPGRGVLANTGDGRLWLTLVQAESDAEPVDLTRAPHPLLAAGRL